jgi:acetyltransferase-like isoleucine patch superfamily enzyme
MRDITIIKTAFGKSGEAWKQKKSVSKVTKNWFCAWLASRMPGKTNQFFYKKMGIKIGKNVQIMPDVRMDIFFPELIEIGDNVIVGQETFFACHEFNVHEFRYGKIKIGKNVLVGARAFLLPGIEVGDNAIVPANTTIYKDVPQNNIAFGSPLQFKAFGKSFSKKADKSQPKKFKIKK